MKILVVDDDSVTLSAFVELLAMDGNETDHAANGHGALTMLPIFRPDVVVLDWRMPYADGAGFLRTIRADPRWCHLPVVILTALSSEELVEEMQTVVAIASPYRVLIKPVSVERLKETLRELVGLSV